MATEGTFKPKVFGEKNKGEMHDKIGTPCQDNFAHARLPSGQILIAVADGLGSAKRSEVGSDLAVKIAVQQYGFRDGESEREAPA